MDEMKIWVIGRHYPAVNNRMRGSFEIEQAKMLARGGHDVTYIAIVFHPYKKIRNWGFTTWEEEGIRVCGYSCPFFPEKMNVEMARFRTTVLKRALKKVEKTTGIPDIVHVHYPTMITDPDVVLGYQKMGCAIVCTEHWSAVLEKSLSKREEWRLKKYIQLADWFICVGEPLKQSIKEITGTDREIDVIPNVVENIFQPLEKKKKNKIFTFIMVGRLIEIKQVDKVIEAFSKVYPKNPQIRLQLIGEGEARKQLENLVLRLGIEDAVHFTDTLPRKEVASRIGEADCLICYSKVETFGVPIIEAWACGVPVISSDAVGAKTYWKDGMGYIVAADALDELISAMVDVIEHFDEFDRVAIRDYAVKNFNEEKIRARIEIVYKKARRGYQ